jgi:predicted lipoprotein with Yx(FWY)xxD motif
MIKMMKPPGILLAGAGVVVALAVASAAGVGQPRLAGAVAPAPAPAGAATPSASVPASGGTTPERVSLTARPTELGTVVMTDAGVALYRFDNDSAEPPRSNCSGGCATAWPPLMVDQEIAIAGVDSSLLGVIYRPEGGKQLTLGGWPLYRFAGDQQPGDLKGEGVDGIWHAVGPNGKPAIKGTGEPTGSQPNDTGQGTGNGTGY